MTREQDALFAEKVMGKPWMKPHHGNCCTCQTCGWPHDECQCDYGDNEDLVISMMTAIEKLCGTLSQVVLYLENGTYCAIASWFDSYKWRQNKNCGDGTANGALLALGLAVADEVQNMHGEEAL